MVALCYITNIANMAELLDYPSLLRSIRGTLDLSQDQLAKKLGVSFATVNRWEGGVKPQKAAQEAILALASEAGVDTAGGDLESISGASAVTSRRKKTATPPTTKPMEQMLWDAACS